MNFVTFQNSKFWGVTVAHEENNEESLLITKTNGDGYDIVEGIHSLPSGLHYTYIKLVPHVVYKVIF
jgi:hypothetical protein